MPRIRNEQLHERCRRFIHQEAQHGMAHTRYWDNLDAQSYRFRVFQKNVDKLVFRIMDKFSPLKLRISLVSCVEHINAYIGHEFLSQNILAQADPRVKDLMEWHFAEEIEHRRVAFDLLQAVAPNYALRLLWLALTAGLFYSLMYFQTATLLAQDGILWRKQIWRQVKSHMGSRHQMLRRTLRHLLDYLQPGFHPSQTGNDRLAEKVLARLASKMPPAVVPSRLWQPHARERMA